MYKTEYIFYYNQMLIFDIVILVKYTNIKLHYNYYERLYGDLKFVLNHKYTICSGLKRYNHMESVLFICSTNGYIKLVRWIHYNIPRLSTGIMWSGALNVIKWVDSINLPGKDLYSIHNSIIHNQLDVVKYMYDKFRYPYMYIFEMAVKFGNTDVIEWLIDAQLNISADMVCEHGSINMIKWFDRYKLYNSVEQIIIRKDYEIIHWFEQNYPELFTESIIDDRLYQFYVINNRIY